MTMTVARLSLDATATVGSVFEACRFEGAIQGELDPHQPYTEKKLLYLFDEMDADEADIRSDWRRLVDERLPAAALKQSGWPVRFNHCFARILLDNAIGRPWREAIAPPAWRNMPLPVLQTAIDLGEAVIKGEADIWSLNDRSLIMRGKNPRGKKPASQVKRRRLSRNRHGRAAQGRRFGRD